MADPKPADPAMAGLSFPFELATTAAPYASLLHEWHTKLAVHYFGRLQRYAAIPLQIASCRSADDVVEAQLAFCGRLVKDYQSTATELLDLVNSRAESADAESYSATLLKAQEDAGEIIRQAKEQASRILADADKAVVPAKSETSGGKSKAA